MDNLPSREELEARLAAAEARADARFMAFEKAVDDAMGEIRAELSSVHSRLEGLQGIKATTIGTGIAVGGVLIAALALGTTMFDSGRETAQLAADAQKNVDAILAETSRQQAEMREMLNSTLRALDEQQKTQP